MDNNIKCTLYYVLIKLSFGFCYQSSNTGIYNGKLNNQSRQSHNIMYHDNIGTLSKQDLSKQSLSNMGAMVAVTLVSKGKVEHLKMFMRERSLLYVLLS